MFNKDIEEQAKKHAQKEFPKESVGLVVENTYIPVENTHIHPTTDFRVNSDVYAGYLLSGSLQCVIHSHTAKKTDKVPHAYPSKIDMLTQMSFKIPFGIIYTSKERSNKDIIYLGDTVPRQDLVGRTFIHGIQDCYSLIRDYHYETKGVWIKDFPRQWEWWEKDEFLYKDGFVEAGFKEIPISQIKEGDVLLMALTAETLRNNNPCHAGIYLGGDTILHHNCRGLPYDASCLSHKALLQRYQKFVTHCLRYVGEQV